MNKPKRGTFADDVLLDGFVLSPDTHIVDIQSVYENLAFHMDKVKEILPPDALNLMPSNPFFDFVFCEWRRDLYHEIEVQEQRDAEIDTLMAMGRRAGIRYIDYGVYLQNASRLSDTTMLETAKFGTRVGYGDDWLDNHHVYLGVAHVRGISGYIMPGRHGFVLTWNKTDGVIDDEKSGVVHNLYPGGYTDESGQMFHGLPMTAFALMHMKNPVELVEQPRNYQRRYERKTGKKPSPYITIIDPTKPRKQYEGKGGKGGQFVPHTVRGHYRYNHEHGIPHFAHRSFWIEAFNKGELNENSDSRKRNFKIILPDREETE